MLYWIRCDCLHVFGGFNRQVTAALIFSCTRRWRRWRNINTARLIANWIIYVFCWKTARFNCDNWVKGIARRNRQDSKLGQKRFFSILGVALSSCHGTMHPEIPMQTYYISYAYTRNCGSDSSYGWFFFLWYLRYLLDATLKSTVNKTGLSR